MRIICADAESYYDDELSVKRMSTEEYCRKTTPHGWAVKWDATTLPRWHTHEEFKYLAKHEDWSNIGVIHHHAHFDGLLLSHHYGVHPKFFFDTLSYGRLLIGNHLPLSLDSLAQQFNLAPKTVPYDLFKGKRWHELSREVQEQVADGACRDVELTWDLFKILGRQMPREELSVVDITIKMFTNPELIGDTDALAALWESENKAKAERMASLGVSSTELQSSDKFAALLEAEGVEIEYKDGKKSTLLQSRSETIGWMARRGPLPIYLFYAGAHTSRWSGGDDANFQNLPARKPETRRLREAILAPPGYVIGKPDLSQIECRILNFLAGQDDVVEKFKREEDPYVGLASEFYQRPVTKADVNERGTGKQGELSCGYGCGGKKFKGTAKAGTYGPPVELTLEKAQEFVKIYRDSHPRVVDYWKAADRMLSSLANGGTAQCGPMLVRDHRVWLPNGIPLLYTTLEWHVAEDEEDETGWRMKKRKGKKLIWDRMWGSKLVEQTTQALARVVISRAIIRIAALGYRIKNQEHDAMWIVLPKHDPDRHLKICIDEMTRSVDWLPGLPLAAEGSYR